MPTQDLVQSLFDYESETGHLRWSKNRVGRAEAGCRAGTCVRGTRVVCVHKKQYTVRQIVWLYHRGTMPTSKIYPINGCANDTRIENLTLAKDQHWIDAERLRHLLSYEQDTGHFRWKNGRGPRAKTGTIAGRNRFGYNQIHVCGRRYPAHRLAWLYMTGEWPQNDIDHINRNRSDNRWCNLREATRSQNNMNRGPTKANKSGFKGVSWSKCNSKWIARIKVGKKYKHLGCFTSKEDAANAYNRASEIVHGDFGYSNPVVG